MDPFPTAISSGGRWNVLPITSRRASYRSSGYDARDEGSGFQGISGGNGFRFAEKSRRGRPDNLWCERMVPP